MGLRPGVHGVVLCVREKAGLKSRRSAWSSAAPRDPPPAAPPPARRLAPPAPHFRRAEPAAQERQVLRTAGRKLYGCRSKRALRPPAAPTAHATPSARRNCPPAYHVFRARIASVVGEIGQRTGADRARCGDGGEARRAPRRARPLQRPLRAAPCEIEPGHHDAHIGRLLEIEASMPVGGALVTRRLAPGEPERGQIRADRRLGRTGLETRPGLRGPLEGAVPVPPSQREHKRGTQRPVRHEDQEALQAVAVRSGCRHWRSRPGC